VARFTPGDLNRVLLALVRLGCLRNPPLQHHVSQQQAAVGQSTVWLRQRFWTSFVACNPRARLQRLPAYLLSTVLDSMAATRYAALVCKNLPSYQHATCFVHIVDTTPAAVQQPPAVMMPSSMVSAHRGTYRFRPPAVWMADWEDVTSGLLGECKGQAFTAACLLHPHYPVQMYSCNILHPQLQAITRVHHRQ
jgi:hypothetical protein